ncbi:MAG TPA: TQO small subunit DoxD [Chloroflexia bacterium]|jgi:thiosulfate dehydrogenase [quinone] large subunit
MILFGIAVVLGLFFGNSLGGLLGAVIVGAITAAGAWFALSRAEATEPTNTTVQVPDPPFARFLFQDSRAAALWLPIRLFLGWSWFDAGLHKFQNPAWIDTGEAIRGYWTRAVTIPEQGSPPITYEWWRGFIQGLLDSGAHTWFAKVIVFGEIAVGLGLLAGALVGVAAFGGVLMNTSFLLSGSTSTNPIMLLLAIAVMLAWKTAGWLGLDRVLLPALGTPWQKGRLLRGQAATATTPGGSAP